MSRPTTPRCETVAASRAVPPPRSPRPGSREAGATSKVTTATKSHSIQADVAGLSPGRGYRYRFRALGEQGAAGRIARWRPTLRFAIASCLRFDVGHHAAWRDVAGSSPGLVVFVGDHMYRRPSPRTWCAGTYKSDRSRQAAHAASPRLIAGNDHELSNDYAAFRGEHLAVDMHAPRRFCYRA